MAFKHTKTLFHTHPLTKDNKIAVWLRFIIWQLKSRVSDKNFIVKFVNDTKLIVKKGMTGATGNIYVGLLEFEDMGFIAHSLRKEDLFIDVGANVGIYTVLASGVCGAKSISFEPINNALEYLNENIKINELKKLVKVYKNGVGEDQNTLHFSTKLDTVNHVLINSTGFESTAIEVITLDSLNIENNSNIAIKIDVEGFELSFLKGAKNLLENKKLRSVVIEINGLSNRYNVKEDEIHYELLKYGFKPYSYNPITREISEIKSYNDRNTIYLRDIEFINNRVITSKKITVINSEF